MKTSKNFFLPNRGTFRSITLAGTIALTGTVQCFAANLNWAGASGTTSAPGNGAWDTTTPGIWNLGSGAGNAPWTTNTAVFGGTDGTYAVTLGSALTASGITFNNSGYTISATSAQTITTTGALVVAGGKSASIGNNVTIQKTSGGLLIGTAGAATGKLTIEAGATVKSTAGGAGTANVLTGNGLILDISGTFARTSSSVSGSGTNDDTTHIGNNASDNVTVNVKTGGAFSTGGRTVRIGSSGTAVMNIDGGTFSVLSTTSQGHVYLGYNASSNATVNVTAGSFSTNPGNPAAGAGQLIIGLNASSVAALNVSGGTVNAYGRMVLGSSSTNASVTLSGTGGIIVGNTGLTMSESAGSVSVFHLNGGTLTTSAIAKGAVASTATFNLNGGTIKASADNATFMTGLTRANVRDGGAVFDTNGKNVTVAQPLLHSNVVDDLAVDGGLTKLGTGTLTLTGANTYTGTTTISGGTLALGTGGSISASSELALNGGAFNVSALTDYTLGTGQKLSGSGSVSGSLIIDGELAIGSSPGTINFENLTLSGTSTFTFDTIGGTMGAGSADLGNVSGTLVLSNATLDLVQLGTFTESQVFTLFSYTNLTGTFGGLDDGDYFADAGGLWQIAYDGLAGTNGGTGSRFVTITAVPEAGPALLGGLGMLVLLRRRRRNIA